MFGQMRFDDTIRVNRWFHELGELEDRRAVTFCEALTGLFAL